MIKGQCYCGKVKYEVTPPLKFTAHDHCSICRRVAGAAFVTWSGVKEERFKITEGEGELTSFHSTPGATRRFCRHCGSHLFFQGEKWPGEIHFTVSTVTSGMESLPKAHVFYSDKVSWFTPHDDLPKLGGKTGIEKLP